ncbi:GNAT family N-acetyltransferase [Pontibacter qinzhouensis]|uniref:GNAT family N-acetyltransferase n=1 Tax=Pontibacter qinzhouensis TaxID=2603253 RepID=A0A5C8IY05_9BACT|nr:GNAT family N-acetyltransferase [Pontibacter qinzhouensis]TXK26428.1 GNAT family N-acetyltransferase [Pontibacter qinzhouensis]
MNKPEIIFRDGTPADAGMLAALGWQTFEEAFGSYNDPEDMLAFKPTMFSLQLQAEELAEQETEFVIAEADGVPVAYMKLNWDAPPAAINGHRPMQISRLFLLQHWTGKGLGDRLMQVALDRARRWGHQVVWLTVWSKNERALCFYKRHGFRIVGELDFYLGKDVQLDYYMQRKV